MQLVGLKEVVMISQTAKNHKTDAEWLARDMRRDADLADKLADDVAAWGLDCDARGALALIERAQDLVSSGERYVRDDLIGQHTTADLRNEGAIALGITNSHSPRGRGDMGYGLMYAISDFAKYGKREPDGIQPSYTAVKASSIRVYASTLRMVAQLCDELASGKIRWIG